MRHLRIIRATVVLIRINVRINVVALTATATSERRPNNSAGARKKVRLGVLYAVAAGKEAFAATFS
jgi:hypothetical protein